MAQMRAIVAQNLPGTSAAINFYEFYPPMSPTEGNLKVMAVYSLASRDAGLGERRAVEVEPHISWAGSSGQRQRLVESVQGEHVTVRRVADRRAGSGVSGRAAVVAATLAQSTRPHPAGTIIDLGYRWTHDDLRERQLRNEAP